MAELRLGQTVRLSDGRQGTIRFVGGTHFAQGEWVGVELEDDSGKNDGSVQGERYFDCDPGRGMFVRPGTVTVLAQPPTAKTNGRDGVGAKKVGGRPSSLMTGGTSRTSADPDMARRISLNAPSPSPGPGQRRPSSIARVSLLGLFCLCDLSLHAC
jgi:dynactin 1